MEQLGDSKLEKFLVHLLTIFLALYFVDPLSYLIFFLLWFSFIYLAFKKRLAWHLIKAEKILWPLYGLFLLGLLAIFWTPNKKVWLDYLGKDLHYLLFFIFLIYLFKLVDKKKIYLRAMMGASLILLIYGLYEYFFIKSRAWYRLKSLYGNPNHFAGVLIMTLPFFISFALDKQENRPRRVIAGFSSLVGTFLLFHSYSRTGWLSFFVGLVIIAFLKNFRLGLAAIVVVALFLGAFYPALPKYSKDRLTSLLTMDVDAGRLNLWQAACMMCKEQPILGLGTGGYTASLNEYLTRIVGKETQSILTNPHNIWLYIGAEYGLVGFSLFLVFFFKLLKEAWALYRKKEEVSFFYRAGTLAALGALAVNLLADNVIANRAIGMLAIFLVVLLLDLASNNKLGEGTDNCGF